MIFIVNYFFYHQTLEVFCCTDSFVFDKKKNKENFWGKNLKKRFKLIFKKINFETEKENICEN